MGVHTLRVKQIHDDTYSFSPDYNSMHICQIYIGHVK